MAQTAEGSHKLFASPRSAQQGGQPQDSQDGSNLYLLSSVAGPRGLEQDVGFNKIKYGILVFLCLPELDMNKIHNGNQHKRNSLNILVNVQIRVSHTSESSSLTRALESEKYMKWKLEQISKTIPTGVI